MLEKVVEKKVCDHAKSMGWLVYKFVSPGRSGVPDRMFIKAGRIVFVEFKQLGKRPTKLQRYHIGLLRQHEVEVYVIDNVEDGKELFNEEK